MKLATLHVVISLMVITPIIHGYQESFHGKMQSQFDEKAISDELITHIKRLLPQGKTILVLGSGWESEELSNHYSIYSIEQDEPPVSTYDTHYIYAPIVDDWYDVKVLEQQLPKAYDLILVDGPTLDIGRRGFYTNLALFNTNVPIIINDVQRKEEYVLMLEVAKKLEKTYITFPTKDKQEYGIVI